MVPLRRYTIRMLLLFAAAGVALYSSSPNHPEPNYHPDNHHPSSLIAEATATVRILSGVRITSTIPSPDAHVRTVQLIGSDGRNQTGQLVEFE